MKFKKPIPSDHDVLSQLATGLEYIHSKKLTHRDIKPHNALIWIDESKADVKRIVLKWADFGYSKEVNDNYSFTVSSIKGTRNWKAPELLANKDSNKRGTVNSDVYSEGLVFAYFLLDGQHPFGSGVNIEVNILNGNLISIQGNFPRRYVKLLLNS